jgi:hypothetical protein
MRHRGGALAFVASVGVLLLGCRACATLSDGFGDSKRYWAHGCVTSDRHLLAVCGDGWAAIDMDRGVLLHAQESGLTHGVKCGDATAKVFAVGKSVVLPSGAQEPESDDWKDTLLTTLDGTRVRVWRSYDRRGRAQGYTNLSILLPGATEKRIELRPAMFGAVGSARSSSSHDDWITLTPGPLVAGRLVLVAGFKSDGTGAPVPWAFFTLDLASGAPAQLGPTRTAANRSLGELRQIDAFAGDRKYVLVFGSGDDFEVGLYDPLAIEPNWTVPMRSQGATAVKLSPKADRILIRSELEGTAKMQLRLADVTTGRDVWASGVIPEHIFVAEFLSDGSFVYATSNRTAARRGPDGIEHWALDVSARRD